MKQPPTIKHAYIDFDGFFAGVEEQARPHLRGKAIGVIPFEHATATCIIAANAKAKKTGVKTGMSVRDAKERCPSIELVAQSPDLYLRAHNRLMLEIEHEIPIDMVCSIDELCCKLDDEAIADPHGLAKRIKARLKAKIGPYITASIGMGPNRQLAKIASDMDKPNGVTILNPADLPGRLFELEPDDLPGISKGILLRLNRAGIWNMEHLWQAEPKRLRALWGNVNGERFWYALHGYDIKAEMTERRMYGHGRVLPPEWRNFDKAIICSRLLTTKAARRMRRAGFLAKCFSLWIRIFHSHTKGSYGWSGCYHLDEANDDHSGLMALDSLWSKAQRELPPRSKLRNVHIAFHDLIRHDQKQERLFTASKPDDDRWAKLSETMDSINSKYARTLVSQGMWVQPPGGYAGGKISFARIPDMEDFW